MAVRLLPSLSVAALSASVFAGGPLTPPGAPSPTPGPEPRTAINDLPGSALAAHVISEPGSYYLSGNIEVTTPGLHGVYINTPGPVSIDGMGFSMIGASGTGSALLIFDATDEPISAQVSKVQVRGWDSAVKKEISGGSTNDSTEDDLRMYNWSYSILPHIEQAVSWTGNLTIEGATVRGGGIANSGGTLTISNSIVSHNAVAPTIEADGLFMTDVESRGGTGVVAKKPREIVVVGSKVKDVVRGVAFDLAAGAVVRECESDGTVDGRDFLIWQRNFSTFNLSDPYYAPSSFGAGSRIEGSVFQIINAGDAGGQRVLCGEGTVFANNTITYTGLENHASLVRFDGGQCTIVGNTARGIPAGSAGFEVNDLLNLVYDNTFIGAGNSSIGVIGTAGRSIFRNNTMMNVGAPFDLFGVGFNHIGAVLTPTSAPGNDTPDRNLAIPPVDPVR